MVGPDFGRKYIENNGLPITKLLELALREGNSRLPVYRMHKWWARRLGSAIRAVLLGLLLPDNISEKTFWDIYSSPSIGSNIPINDDYTILDPFMGGGSSMIEARRLGLSCVGFDIDPMAWFVTRQALNSVEPEVVEKAFERLREEVESKVAGFYKTRTESGEERQVIYYFWVRTVTCPHCTQVIELHPHYQLKRNRKSHMQTCFCRSCHQIYEVPDGQKILTCEKCGEVTEVERGNISRTQIICPNCEHKWSRNKIRKEQGFSGLRLFALQYLERGDKNRFVKRFKSADDFDLALFERAKREFQTLARTFSMITTFLNTAIPLEGREDPRPVNYGFHSYSDLFNARQLLCLASVLEAISSIENTAIQESLLLAFSDSLASNNMLCYYAFDYDKVTPLFGLHGYNMVTRPVENNVWGAPLGRGTFKNCVAKMLKGLRGMSSYDWSSVENKRAGNCFPELPASDSSDLPRPASTGRHYVDLRRASARQIQLPDHSIDLILTDPPYFDNLNYGEMSDFYYAWLRPILKNRYPQEFQPLNCVGMVDRIHGNGDQESLDRFRNGLVQVFSECNRVLREAGIMALTFHHKRRKPWSALVEALNQAGFTVIQLVPLRSEGRSGFHSAPGNLKWDAVLVCRPSASGPCLCIETGKADAIHLLKKWERQLGKVVGGPSEEDWRSLGFAVDCFLNQSILRERLGNIPICSQGGES